MYRTLNLHISPESYVMAPVSQQLILSPKLVGMLDGRLLVGCAHYSSSTSDDKNAAHRR